MIMCEFRCRCREIHIIYTPILTIYIHAEKDFSHRGKEVGVAVRDTGTICSSRPSSSARRWCGACKTRVP